jgi:putative ABC transport system permease protein
MKFLYVAIIMIVLSTAFTYLAAKNISKESPASTLIPKVPKVSSKGMLENSRFWKRLGFNGRWNYRDIKRNKIRSLVTIISIMGCTILLISAFGMNDGMNDLKTWQYGDINHYETQMIFDDNITTDQINDITSKYDGVQVMNQQIEIKANNVTKTSNIMAYNKTDLITPTDKTMKPLDLPEDGVSLTQKSADLLHVDKGDTIEWHIYGDDKWVNTTVDEIYADPANQGITLRQHKLEELGYNFTPSMFVTKNHIDGKVEGVSTINDFSKLQESWDELMESANLMIAILLIFALCLSVVMLYSLGILAFTEVQRDLATLKVIGFKTKNIRRLFLTQNLILSIIGFIFGVPLGYYVLRIMMDTSGDTFYYPINYSVTTIFLTFVLVVGLSIVVNLLFSRKIKNIDMVKALKKARD